jgi:LPS-assembly lipoprotein
MQRVKYFISLNIIILAVLLSGCGFHLRQPEDLPPAFHTLYLTSPNPYSELTAQLTNLLKSMQVELLAHPQPGVIHLEILSEAFSHAHPKVFSTTLPTHYYYYLTVEFLLADSQGKPLGPIQVFRTQQVISLIGNQILVPGTSEPIQQALIRQMANRILDWLIIQDIPNAR